MPKEYIDSKVPRFTENGVQHDDPFRVKVTWGEEQGTVQLATINPSTESAYDGTGGYYIDLDRRSINDLIKVLRRARDKTYGRDE